MSVHRFVTYATAVLLFLAGTAGGTNVAPLADATEKQDAAIVQALLAEGVDLNTAQADGMTALHWQRTTIIRITPAGLSLPAQMSRRPTATV